MKPPNPRLVDPDDPLWWPEKHQMWHPDEAARYQKAVERLRAACAEFERGFTGREQIAEYLMTQGFRNLGRKPITAITVRYWEKCFNFPVFRYSKKDQPTTTNLMILAWLWERKSIRELRR